MGGSFLVSSLRATSRSSAGSCDSAPATAGRPGPEGSANSGSEGCHTRRKATMAPVPSSEATMSVSSTEM